MKNAILGVLRSLFRLCTGSPRPEAAPAEHASDSDSPIADVSYSDYGAELVVVCRSDVGLLVLSLHVDGAQIDARGCEPASVAGAPGVLRHAAVVLAASLKPLPCCGGVGVHFAACPDAAEGLDMAAESMRTREDRDADREAC